MTVDLDTDLSDLDWERLRVQHLTPPHAITPTTLPTSTLNPNLSTIKPVEERELFTPTLKPILEHPALPSIRLFRKMEKSAVQQAAIFDTDATKGMIEIEQRYDEKEAAIRECIKKESQRKTWGMVTTIFQYLATSASVFLGIAAIAAKAVAPGVALIVSGSLGLLTRIGHDLDVFHKIAAHFVSSSALRDQLARRIEMGAFLLSLVGSVGAGFWAYGAGAFGKAAGEVISSKIGEGAQTGFSLLGAGFRLREAQIHKQSTEALNKTKLLQLQADTAYYRVNDSTQQTRKMMESMGTIGQQIKQIIYACSHAASE